MSSTVSVQQILGEARRLVGRLREQDGNADRLLAQAQALSQGVEAMRQYHEELAQLSCVATTPRPRAALVLSIQQENRHMRELQQENRELVAALKEHQSALELIMAKYREQVARLGSVCQAEQRLGEGNQDCHHLADKICEMAEVMRRAAEIDELVGARQTETLVRLSTENAVLRQLLDIGRRAGSAGLSDVEVQTDSGSVASPE
ncbi:FGFR1 oncogene partner 2 homolog isoform X2 [Rhipicephalus sanguineus]|uniref:FGFR1 oncogene partner 2 homolog isoform X2 n=1 Tax=Rhipicephalus sanguineus TaxID=34632 RepID=UPI0018935380|nr:FGFR1 oncogene partner 2 homolog isoform X2 [Rhipicephalus sanguineus]